MLGQEVTHSCPVLRLFLQSFMRIEVSQKVRMADLLHDER